MKQDELNLIVQMVELAGDVGAIKAERDALKRENEFLRGLLADKLKDISRDSASETTEDA